MTAPPPLPSAGRADRARRAASTVDPSNPIRPGPRSCPRRAGHGQRPRPRTREPNGPRRCMWAISVPCALPDRIMRMGQWATCRTDHAAHAKAHVRAGIADHPDGPWTVQGMVPRTTLTDHGCLCSISCCGFSHDDFSGLGRACRPRNGLNWMVLVSPPERTGKDYDQHAPSTVYPSFAAERGIRRVDRAENTCQRADGA